MPTVCVKCQQEFVRTHDHPGYVNVCRECSKEQDVDRVMAKVAWSGKHTVEIEITADRNAAISFNKAQKRWGAGVTRSLIAGRESQAGKEARKDGSGAEPGAMYYSHLGEKRTVKR